MAKGDLEPVVLRAGPWSRAPRARSNDGASGSRRCCGARARARCCGQATAARAISTTPPSLHGADAFAATAPARTRRSCTPRSSRATSGASGCSSTTSHAVDLGAENDPARPALRRPASSRSRPCWCAGAHQALAQPATRGADPRGARREGREPRHAQAPACSWTTPRPVSVREARRGRERRSICALTRTARDNVRLRSSAVNCQAEAVNGSLDYNAYRAAGPADDLDTLSNR